MESEIEQPQIAFFSYPDIGTDSWKYIYNTATARILMSKMLSKASLINAANAENYEVALEIFSATDYKIGQNASIAEVENALNVQKLNILKTFSELMFDENIIALFKSRADFSNLRLALKRKLAGKPIGEDYTEDGNVTARELIDAVGGENFDKLPKYVEPAVERAVLSYFGNKDARQIDCSIDYIQAQYNIEKAMELENVFLLELFRMQIDLTNIKTLLRLKFRKSEMKNVFLPGGYIPIDLLSHMMHLEYEAIGTYFYSYPYYDVIESSIHHLTTEKSFLTVEHICDKHVNNFLMLSESITAGPQPIVAYFLLMEYEIKMVRMILTGKKNKIDAELILDRLGE